jgi:hypothetical protein
MQNNPTLEIEKLVQDMQQNMHTCIPGKIDSFDADKCLAVVTPIGQFKQPNGKLLDYPQVNDVPVVFIQSAGQDITIAYPIKQGDGCLLFFSEQQLDKFRDDEDAKCDLRFDLTNAICLVGLFKDANSVIKEACDNDAVIIDNKGKSRVTIKEDEQECKVGDNSTLTIQGDNQEAVVGGAKWTLANGKLLVDCDLEVTGKVTAQQTIDATGDITSNALVKGLDVQATSTQSNLATHMHPTAALGPPSPPTPGT